MILMDTPEWEEVDVVLREVAEKCKALVAHLPRGQKGAAYRECVRRALEGL